MQIVRKPFFQIGRVVKKEGLDCLRDFPYELAGLLYETYSDGILFGFDITYQEGQILVSSGAIKYSGDIILIKEEILPFSHYEMVVSVKIKFLLKEITEDFEQIGIEFLIDTILETKEDEMEIGRFCLSKGAVLRSQYNGVEDFKTHFNTLDITNVRYAAPDSSTLAPKLLKIFAESLLQTDTENPYDLSFSFQCFNSTRIERKGILWYLSKRLNIPYTDRSNEEIYKQMIQILQNKPIKLDSKRNVTKRGPSIM